ncbi:hypothetical protein [Promicromonospora panici]|uniref:hypothetical protein n=1 Tax=Promicromonospora panici TaxID=2219658 RepID=UPI00101C8457|nr:hypothetical protein [Promicromonospora panici]
MDATSALPRGAQAEPATPYGFTSSDDGNEILDDSGEVVAVVGQEYQFGGGEYALDDEVWSDGPRVSSLWLTGAISERR